MSRCICLQVLSRDIRSLFQRTLVAPVAQQVAAQQPAQEQQQQQNKVEQQQPVQDAVLPPPLQQQKGGLYKHHPYYRVTLDGVEIVYHIDAASGHVTVVDAAAQGSTPL